MFWSSGLLQGQQQQGLWSAYAAKVCNTFFLLSSLLPVISTSLQPLVCVTFPLYNLQCLPEIYEAFKLNWILFSITQIQYMSITPQLRYFQQCYKYHLTLSSSSAHIFSSSLKIKETNNITLKQDSDQQSWLKAWGPKHRHNQREIHMEPECATLLSCF